MAKKYQPYDKIICRIKVRPEYKGRKARPEVQELNGQILLMQVLWLQDDGDKYPGEYALRPDDKDTWFKWSEKNGVGWIASGDVEILEPCHVEKNFFNLSEKNFMVVNKKNGDMAFGLRVKELAENGVETVIINRNFFSCYNKLMSMNEVMLVVEGVDDMEDSKIRWGSKTQYSEIADEY